MWHYARCHQQYNHAADATQNRQTGFFYTTQIPATLNYPTTARQPAKDLQGSIHERRNNHWHHTTNTDVNRHGRLRSSFTETLPRCDETLPVGKERN